MFLANIDMYTKLAHRGRYVVGGATFNHRLKLTSRSVHDFDKLNRLGEGTYGVVCASAFCDVWSYIYQTGQEIVIQVILLPSNKCVWKLKKTVFL